MSNFRWVFSAVVLIGAIYAIGQGTSTSQSQSGNGRSSASASSSARSGGGQSGNFSGFGQNNGVVTSILRPTHVVTYRFNDRPAANVVHQIDASLMEQQNQFWHRLGQAGKLVMAGYWREKDGAMAVLAVRDDREAMQLMQADPSVKQGASYEIRAYNPTVINYLAPAPAATPANNQNSNDSQNTSSSQNNSSNSTQKTGGR